MAVGGWQVNALALSDGEEKALVITGDFMYTWEKTLTRIRSMIEERTGVPMDHILIQSIHQHTSTSPDIGGLTDRTYQSVHQRKFADAAQMALDDLADARVFIGEKETSEPVSFVRRFRMKDGTTKTNPGKQRDEIDHALGEPDNTVRLVRFAREKGDIALVGFQTHPDTTGGTKFSADWPGFVRRMTEEAKPGVHCILVNGCEGDTNHIDVTKPPRDKTAPDYDCRAHARFMGRIITDAALAAWDDAKEVDPGKVSGAVEVKRIPANTNGIDRLDECIELHRQIVNGTLQVKMDMAARGEARRIAAMENVTLIQRVPVTVIGFGKVAVVGYAGEPFTEYADNPRKEVPELFILSACLANGAIGYLPSVSAFEEGGYEARTTNLTPCVAPETQSAAIAMLRAHLNKNNG